MFRKILFLFLINNLFIFNITIFTTFAKENNDISRFEQPTKPPSNFFAYDGFIETPPNKIVLISFLIINLFFILIGFYKKYIKNQKEKK